MRTYIGRFRENGDPEQAVIGVPARDLTEEEWRAAVSAGLIVEGEPTSELWTKERDERVGRDERDSDDLDAAPTAGATRPRSARKDGE